MAIAAVVTDLDGTLWWGQERVHPSTAPALADLRRRGIDVVVATGRRLSSARLGLEPLDLCGPAVLMSGALGADLRTGREWHRRAFAADAARRVHAGMTGHGLEPVVYVCDPDVDAVFGPGCATDPRHLATLGQPGPRDVTSILESGRVVGFGLCGMDERWASTLIAIAQDLDGAAMAWQGPDHVYGGCSLMLGPPEVSKAAALAAWCDAGGISADQVLAVGDGSNDVEMLDWAGVAVAVTGGAADAHGADHRIPPPQDGGWAQLLELIA